MCRISSAKNALDAPESVFPCCNTLVAAALLLLSLLLFCLFIHRGNLGAFVCVAAIRKDCWIGFANPPSSSSSSSSRVCAAVPKICANDGAWCNCHYYSPPLLLRPTLRLYADASLRLHRRRFSRPVSIPFPPLTSRVLPP